jgi:hypothetical protein
MGGLASDANCWKQGPRLAYMKLCAGQVEAWMEEGGPEARGVRTQGDRWASRLAIVPAFVCAQ